MMSAANSALKEECGNEERFERVACRSFDHLSVTRERGEERRDLCLCFQLCRVGRCWSWPGKQRFVGTRTETWSSDPRYQQRILKRFYESR